MNSQLPELVKDMEGLTGLPAWLPRVGCAPIRLDSEPAKVIGFLPATSPLQEASKLVFRPPGAADGAGPNGLAEPALGLLVAAVPLEQPGELQHRLDVPGLGRLAQDVFCFLAPAKPFQHP